jgi:hypothetical protein
MMQAVENQIDILEDTSLLFGDDLYRNSIIYSNDINKNRNNISPYLAGKNLTNLSFDYNKLINIANLAFRHSSELNNQIKNRDFDVFLSIINDANTSHPSEDKSESLKTAKINPCSIAMPILPPFLEAYDEVLTYERFEEGWDGFRGCKFSLNVITQAKNILNQIDSYCQFNNIDYQNIEIVTGPAEDGTLDIEIRYNGKEIFILIDEEKGVTIDKWENDHCDETHIFTTSDFNKDLSWLFNKENIFILQPLEREHLKSPYSKNL